MSIARDVGQALGEEYAIRVVNTLSNEFSAVKVYAHSLTEAQEKVATYLWRTAQRNWEVVS